MPTCSQPLKEGWITTTSTIRKSYRGGWTEDPFAALPISGRGVKLSGVTENKNITKEIKLFWWRVLTLNCYVKVLKNADDRTVKRLLRPVLEYLKLLNLRIQYLHSSTYYSSCCKNNNRGKNESHNCFELHQYFIIFIDHNECYIKILYPRRFLWSPWYAFFIWFGCCQPLRLFIPSRQIPYHAEQSSGSSRQQRWVRR